MMVSITVTNVPPGLERESSPKFFRHVHDVLQSKAFLNFISRNKVKSAKKPRSDIYCVESCNREKCLTRQVFTANLHCIMYVIA